MEIYESCWKAVKLWRTQVLGQLAIWRGFVAALSSAYNTSNKSIFIFYCNEKCGKNNFCGFFISEFLRTNAISLEAT